MAILPEVGVQMGTNDETRFSSFRLDSPLHSASDSFELLSPLALSESSDDQAALPGDGVQIAPASPLVESETPIQDASPRITFSVNPEEDSVRYKDLKDDQVRVVRSKLVEDTITI